MTLRNHIRHIPPVLALVLLSGCSMAPEYARPAAPVAAAWPAGLAYDMAPQGDAAAVAASKVKWQEFFTSPDLQKLISTALENNRDLRVAALNIEAARAAYRIQRSDRLPKLDGQAQISRTGVPENASPTGSDTIESQYSVGLGVTAFELDLFGRVKSLSDAALEQYLATTEAEKTARISLIAEVSNTYLQLLADQKLLKLTEDTLKAQQQSFDLIQKSFDSGIGSQLDVSRARTQVETARANRAQYLRLIEQDKNALALLLGKPVDGVLTGAETLDDIKIASTLPSGLPSDVLLDRPDVRAAEHVLKAQNAEIGAARAAFFPRITLTGSAGLASASLSDLFKSGSATAWSFMPQATLPIFNAGENIANLDAAKAQHDIAVAQYEKSIQTAFREVADELAARGTLSEQLSAQHDLVQANQDAYTLSEARYNHGIDSYLSVLDTQRELYAAQQGEISVQRQMLSNLVTLYKVLGGGVI
jgi:multidrug efflux system outer membrane protein